VLFTRRSEHLPRHAGEISFPGGIRHDEDPDLRATALRESHEELGLSGSDVDVLGALPAVHTFVSGILVVPFVGMLRGRPALVPHEGEIAAVLEYGLAELDAAERPVSFEREGLTYHGYAYEMGEHTIWGATARILHGMLEIIRSGTEPAEAPGERRGSGGQPR
jgi:8-oxo-dGTP pyrophosphatase MutT (NUDIX family)